MTADHLYGDDICQGCMSRDDLCMCDLLDSEGDQ